MDGNSAPANQGIDDMSFKDLTARAAAAMKWKTSETATRAAKVKTPETAAKETTPKPKTS
jgi:hypothetical protein